MTYDNFISQFEILDNPPWKKGFHRHHIVPRSEQIVKDDRQVYLLPSQHAYAHWLYDLEHGTQTMDWLLSKSGMTKKGISCYEDFLVLDESPWISYDSREKISKKMKGIVFSDEHKENLKKAWVYRNHATPDDVKKKISESQINNPQKSKVVQQFTKDGQLLAEYPSLAEATRQTGVPFSNICKCCKGIRPYAGNYKWKYKTAI